METLEELYNLEKNEVDTVRVETDSGRWLEVFKSPGQVLVDIEFPEFTCLCPKTSQPDFAEIRLVYIPDTVCVELKSLKYFYNSFRDEGHFHEEVMVLMEKDLRKALKPLKLWIQGDFNRRGGMNPVVECGDNIGVD